MPHQTVQMFKHHNTKAINYFKFTITYCKQGGHLILHQDLNGVGVGGNVPTIF
jgi:hypothetical protein